MGIWQRFTRLLGDGALAMGGLIERVGALLGGDPEERRHMAFSIAMVALSAKMAKADGVVTFDEVAAFRRLVSVSEGEARYVDRLFNLARRDVAGYQSYALKIAALYEADDPILSDIVEGLFGIATADRVVHEAELDYLADVAQLFGLSADAFDRIKVRHVEAAESDPYRILGAARTMSFDELRLAYRRLVAEHHPDRLMARGVPPEFITLANHRMATINVAWERIERERRG